MNYADFNRIADTVARVAELSPKQAEAATRVVLSFPADTLFRAGAPEPRITERQHLALRTMEARYDKEPMLSHTEREHHKEIERKRILGEGEKINAEEWQAYMNKRSKHFGR